ncbi:MAG: hypothetical protein ACE5LB_16435, partial [Acidiferrobacterales bacterium]
GLNFTLSYSTQERTGDPDDNTNTYFKIGWKKAKHAVSLSAGRQTDTSFDNGALTGAKDDEASSVAVAYVYKPAKQVEIYGSVRQSSIDASGPGIDDITGVWIGSRIKWK